MAGEIFIALEDTSQAIKTAVEETKTEVESVGTAVTEIKEDVGDGAGTDLVTRVANLEAKIDALASGGGGISSCIRHIQRGTITIEVGDKTASVTLSGFTDLSKMVVLLYGTAIIEQTVISTNKLYASKSAYVESLTKTALNIALDTVIYKGNSNFSYQVIEFY